jgi:beta-lactamase regulating signal transducer with metallopeptidase domain
MPVTIQYLQGQGLGPCASLHPTTHSISPAINANRAAASATSEVPGSLDNTITIALAAVGAILALASLVVALLQYRLHLRQLRGPRNDGDALPMEVHLQDRDVRPT